MPEQVVAQDTTNATLTFECGHRVIVPWDSNHDIEVYACEYHLETGQLGYEGLALLSITRA